MLDPFRAPDTAPRLLSYLYEGLTRARDGVIEPALAVQWDVDPRLRTWTFHLRSGVRFHDGSALTASTVVASVARLLTAPPHGVPRAERLEAPDDSTVVITLEAPFAALAAVLATLPAVIVRDTAAAPSTRAAVGTGPWKLLRWRPGVGFSLAANAAYWSGRPVEDSLVVRARGSATVAAFHAGDVDAVSVADSEVASWMQTDDGEANLRAAEPSRLWFVAINVNRPALRDPSVRRALNVALDRAALIRQFTGGHGVAAGGVIPPPFAAADSARIAFPFDTALARRLLFRRRSADSLQLELVAPETAPYASLASAVARALGVAGIAVRVVTLAPERLATRVAAGDADLVLGSWVSAYPDPDGSLFPLLHSASRGSGGNASFYGSPEVDDLIRRARREPDDSARASLARRADAVAFGDAAMILLYFTGELTAVQSWVSGFDDRDRWVHARLGR